MINFWTRVLSDDEITSIYNSALGRQYPFGWTRKIINNIALKKINGILTTGISKINGITG